MSDWEVVSDFYRQQVSAWIDELIATDPDQQLRRHLALNRHSIVQQLSNQAELAFLRKVASKAPDNVSSFADEDVEHRVMVLSPRVNGRKI